VGGLTLLVIITRRPSWWRVLYPFFFYSRKKKKKNKNKGEGIEKKTPKNKKKKKVKEKNKTEDAPVLKLLEENPPEQTPAANNDHPYHTLPDKVREYCEELGIEKNLLEKYSDYLYNSARFALKDYFPEAIEDMTGKRKVPFATPLMLEHAQTLLRVPKKPIKKLYKIHGDEVGKGGYGSVIIVKCASSQDRFAAKRLPHDTERSIETNLSEIAFLDLCKNHPNFVHYHESLYLLSPEKQPEIWIIMEYLQGGTLREASKSGLFEDIHIAYVAREVLKGLQFLHSRNIAHRDLKSANIMMSIKGDIKLIDMGLCAEFSNGPRYKMLGSNYWIAPEMIQNKPHYYQVDIWSLAVCLLELFNIEPPYAPNSLKCMFMSATLGLNSKIPGTASTIAKNFLEHCFQIDPNRRATAENLLLHPWVKQHKIGTGIIDILKQIFLANSLIHLGF